MATVSEFLIERLRSWGVERVYGYPNDGINGILGALAKAGNQPQFIQARHEETAAFMACGLAKFTGQPGVCLARSGPGAIHLLTGLYDAKSDHQSDAPIPESLPAKNQRIHGPSLYRSQLGLRPTHSTPDVARKVIMRHQELGDLSS